MDTTRQWTNAAQYSTVQYKGKWRRAAEQGAERFMAKWIAAEKVGARLRHAEVCPNVSGRTEVDSLKQAGSCWFARHS